MAWQDAVEDGDGGCVLLLEVTSGAKKTAFPSGFNAWRGRIGIAVHADARDGKANQEVVAAVADHFGVPPGSVALLSGVTDRRKRMQVSGVTAEQAQTFLEDHL